MRVPNSGFLVSNYYSFRTAAGREMPGVNDTAYPRLKSSYTEKELEKYFTPDLFEFSFAQRSVHGRESRLQLLILLKTFQRLGYFVPLREVPERLIAHIAKLLKFKKTPSLDDYEDSGNRRRHVALVREFMRVQPFEDGAKRILLDACREAALTKEDPADIINVGIEELIRLKFELPGFSTLLRTATYIRTQVNRQIHIQVSTELGETGRHHIDSLIKTEPGKTRSEWELLKKDAGKPTLNNLRDLVSHLEWLKSWYVDLNSIKCLPDAKYRNFAAEAKSLDAARMQAMEASKRYTLAAALIKMQVSRRLDDLGDVLVKRIQNIHNKGKLALQEYRIRHQGETDFLISKLHNMLIAIRDTEINQRLPAIEAAAGSDTDNLIERCEAHAAFANDNYAPFLWQFHKAHRNLLFRILDSTEPVSTSTDKSTEKIILFLRTNRNSKSDYVNVEELDLSWVSEKWWTVLRPIKNDLDKHWVDRRHFEVCAFSLLMHELKSGDLYIPGSDRYSDYSQQLISWDEYRSQVESYCEQAGISSNPQQLIGQLKNQLSEIAYEVDSSFPENDTIRIEDGEPILTKHEKKLPPPQLAKLEKLIEERLEKISILDVFSDTEHWLNWTKILGPLSGHDAKISNPVSRYLATIFGYGCGLGPTQTARSLKIMDRRQISWINQRHVTEELLERIIVQVINKYNQFGLPKVWGSGKSASADGTKWDMYEQNLLSEYHIRYGGYGGLGYYHVSDTYIALFSHFIPCGVWEAVYILDGLLKNQSEIQPDTLHADTQGQSTPVFGLAHLLGINLMPRIRNWKDLKLFRPDKEVRYTHIDELFNETIDWNLIANHLPDMLRVAISIKTGKVSASSILKRLGTYSRKNNLYDAFCEIGSVIRTIFLLKYISDPALRSTIHAATNKSESFNDFIKWIRFGGDGTIEENDRDEQRKLIKYNHLVANLVIFHNICNLTNLLNQLEQDGHIFDEETVAAISPYIRSHINRFGDYVFNFERQRPLPSTSFALRNKKFAKAV